MTTRYRLLGGSVKPGAKGPYIRVEDVIKGIEAEWNDECAGYRSNQCEACNVYYRVLTIIDPDYKGWDGYTLMKDGVEKEKSQPGLRHIGRGSATACGSPPAASRSTAGPPGKPRRQRWRSPRFGTPRPRSGPT